ncbi:membrane protein [Streptococcus uberis B362]|nr:membrane protein [Streptococcus uberis B362]
MKLKVFIPISLSTILIVVFGNVLKADSWTITKLILSAVIFELVCFLLSRPKDKHYLALKATIRKFSIFIRQTKYFSIFYLFFLIYELWNETNVLNLLFYIHIIFVFYSIGFILSMNNVQMKE